MGTDVEEALDSPPHNTTGLLLGRRRWVDPSTPQQTHSERERFSHSLEEILVGVVVHIHEVESPPQNIHL